jgi:uncharacterized protein
MRWRKVDNPDVIDARGGGMGSGARVGGGLGLAGVVVVVLLQLLGGGEGFDVPAGFDQNTPGFGAQPGDGIPADQDADKDLKDFSAFVFTDAQNSWQKSFQARAQDYQNAKLVLYSGGVNTGCGSASSAVGPFYCPADKRVYLDLSFYREMSQRLGASGDFAWAYVIAHEMGHHVQQETGTSDRVRDLQQENRDEANALSVRLELQADCYSGVWAHTAYQGGALEEGDLEEAFAASEAVGDDRLQRQSTGRIDPDSFTHGSSAQRRSWFDRGYKSGDPGDCDTFAADSV